MKSFKTAILKINLAMFLVSSISPTITAVAQAASYNHKVYVHDLIVDGSNGVTVQDPTGASQCDALTCNAVSGDFIVTPSLFDYGQVAAGSWATKNVTLKNNGKSIIKLGGYSFSDPAISSISLYKCPTYLTAGSSCTAIVQFSPKLENIAYSGVVTFKSSANDASFSYSGIGAKPGIVMAPNLVDFGDVSVLANRSAKNVLITNISDTTANITGYSVSDTTSFAVQLGADCATLSAGASCQATVTPSTVGDQSATFALSVKTGTVTTMTSISLAKTIPTGVLSVSPSAIVENYSTIDGSNILKTINVSNSGTAILSGLAITSALDSGIITNSNCSSTLDVGALCSISVKAIADQDKQPKGIVYLNYVGSAAPVSIPVAINIGKYATGASSYTSVSPSNIDFGKVYPVSGKIASDEKTVSVNFFPASAQAKAGITLSVPADVTVSDDNCTGIWLSASNTACTFKIKLSSSTLYDQFLEALTVRAVDTSNKTINTNNIYLSGKAFSADLAVSTNSVAFGSSALPIATLTPTTKQLTITNNGNLPATNITASSTNSILTIDKNFATKCSGLAIGASCSFDVTVNAKNPGSFTGTINIGSNPIMFVDGKKSSLAVNYAVEATIDPILLASTTTLDFGTVASYATPMPKTVEIMNVGGAVASLSNLTISNPSFSYTHNCGLTLAIGASCYITVTPNVTATKLDAAISVTEANTAKSTVINVKGILQNSGLDSVVKVNPGSLTWLNYLPIGETDYPQDITVSNNSALDLNISYGTNSTTFPITAKTCQTVLKSGTSCVLTISLAPQDPIVSQGLLTVNLASADGKSSAVKKVNVDYINSISASGTFSISNLDLGLMAYAPGMSVEKTLYIKNSTTSAVLLGTPQLSSGSFSPYLTISDKTTCADTLQAGDYCKVVVVVDLSKEGAISEQLNFSSGVSALKGTVVKYSKLTIDPAVVHFEGSMGLASDTQTLTVTNNGYASAYMSKFEAWFYNGETINTTCTNGVEIPVNGTCTITLGSNNIPFGNVSSNSSFSWAGSVDMITADGSYTAASIQGVTHVPDLSAVVSAGSDFGKVYVGKMSDERVLTITNTSTSGILQVSGVSSSTNFSVIDWSNCGKRIAPGGSCAVRVAFSPKQEGDISESLKITSNQGYPYYTLINLTGSGVLNFDGTDMLSPSNISYSTPVGTAQSQTITLTNTQPETIAVGNIATDLPGLTISSNNCTGKTLNQTQSCQFIASFSASDFVAYDTRTIAVAIPSHNRTIALTIDSAQTTPQIPTLTTVSSADGLNIVEQTKSLTLNGTAYYATGVQVLVDGALASTLWSYTVVDQNTISLIPSSLVPVGTYLISVKNTAGTTVAKSVNVTALKTYPELMTSKNNVYFYDKAEYGTYTDTVMLSNTGKADLSISSIVLNNNTDYAISTDCQYSKKLAPSEFCYINVSYTPTSLSQSTTISVLSDGGNKTIGLTGTATAAPYIQSSAAAIPFSNVAANDVISKTVLIYNTGSAALSVSSITLSNGSSFNIVQNTCNVVAVGDSCYVTISANTSTIGTFTDTLTVLSSAGNNPSLAIPVTATVQGASLTITPQTDANFGSILVNTSVSKSFTVTNNGNIPALISGVAAVGNSYLSISSNNCGSSIAVGVSCSVTVKWLPTASSGLTGAYLSIKGTFAQLEVQQPFTGTVAGFNAGLLNMRSDVTMGTAAADVKLATKTLDTTGASYQDVTIYLPRNTSTRGSAQVNYQITGDTSQFKIVGVSAFYPTTYFSSYVAQATSCGATIATSGVTTTTPCTSVEQGVSNYTNQMVTVRYYNNVKGSQSVTLSAIGYGGTVITGTSSIKITGTTEFNPKMTNMYSDIPMSTIASNVIIPYKAYDSTGANYTDVSVYIGRDSSTFGSGALNYTLSGDTSEFKIIGVSQYYPTTYFSSWITQAQSCSAVISADGSSTTAPCVAQDPNVGTVNPYKNQVVTVRFYNKTIGSYSVRLTATGANGTTISGVNSILISGTSQDNPVFKGMSSSVSTYTGLSSALYGSVSQGTTASKTFYLSRDTATYGFAPVMFQLDTGDSSQFNITAFGSSTSTGVLGGCSGSTPSIAANKQSTSTCIFWDPYGVSYPAYSNAYVTVAYAPTVTGNHSIVLRAVPGSGVTINGNSSITLTGQSLNNPAFKGMSSSATTYTPVTSMAYGSANLNTTVSKTFYLSRDTTTYGSAPVSFQLTSGNSTQFSITAVGSITAAGTTGGCTGTAPVISTDKQSTTTCTLWDPFSTTYPTYNSGYVTVAYTPVSAGSHSITLSAIAGTGVTINGGSSVTLTGSGVNTLVSYTDTASSTTAYRYSDGTVASSCQVYKQGSTYAGVATSSGNYWIDTGSGAFSVYCDMTTDGGGWTKIVSQLEASPTNNWNGGVNGSAFALASTKIPSHTQIAFGKDNNPTFVDYVTGTYSTGDIAKTILTSPKTGNKYYIHRNIAGYYGSHNPDGTYYASSTNSTWSNTLTIENSATTANSYTWAFSPNVGATQRGYSMNGSDVQSTSESYAWTVWVR